MNQLTRLFRSLSGLALVGLLASCSCGSKVEQKRSGLVVINVLDKEVYDDCHIKGSVNVPFTKLSEYAQGLDPETAEVVVYCSNYMCSTSGHACKQLMKMGFKHVWAYEGGTAEWYQMGLPVEGPCKNSYLIQKIMPPRHEGEQAIAIITTQELAEKMHVSAAKPSH
ncbi:MAG: rhodanese-like domain-containing protein [Candidatus Babeliales bacterium]